MKQFLILVFSVVIPALSYAEQPTREILTQLFGGMPERKPLKVDTLETVSLNGGNRYKGSSSKKQLPISQQR